MRYRQGTLPRRVLFTACLYTCLGLGALCAAGTAQAQDYQQYEPKPPVPSAAPPATAERAPEPQSGLDDEVLIPELKGIVFIDAPGKLVTGGVKTEGITTSGIELLQTRGFAEVVTPYLGKPLSQRSLRALATDVIRFFRTHDRPVVDVNAPPQDITGGVVQLVFMEGRVARVLVEGNQWFDDELLIRRIRLSSGDPISARRLLDDVGRLNQNPFHQSTVVFTPGSNVTDTDIVLRTADRFPLRGYAGYENTGNALTGRDRYIAGLNWGNVFQLGHQLNYQFTNSFNDGSLVAHSGSYLIPFDWAATLTLFGAHSASSAVTQGATLRGTGTQAGLRYEFSLPQVKGYGQSVQLGLDWKRSNNSLEFGAIAPNPAMTDVAQFVVGYTGSWSDRFGSTSVTPQLVRSSPWKLLSHQSDADYGLQRPGSEARYGYARLALDRLTLLPWGLSVDNSLLYQKSNGRLLQSEQLQFGGYSSIRGYDEYDISNTDEGVVLHNELRLPAFGPLRAAGVRARDQLQALVSFDYGVARAYDSDLTLNDGTAHRRVTMSSVGVGLRYVVAPYVSLRADWNRQLQSTGDQDRSFVHVGVVVGN